MISMPYVYCARFYAASVPYHNGMQFDSLGNVEGKMNHFDRANDFLLQKV